MQNSALIISIHTQDSYKKNSDFNTKDACALWLLRYKKRER